MQLLFRLAPAERSVRLSPHSAQKSMLFATVVFHPLAGWCHDRQCKQPAFCACFEPQSSHVSASSRLTSSLGSWPPFWEKSGSRSVSMALSCLLNGMPPNRATNGFFPLARSTTTCQQRNVPYGVSVVARYFSDRAFKLFRCFRANVLNSEACMTQCSL